MNGAAQEKASARKNREKQQRIDSIIASARAVFFSKGYLKATMDEIARGAEVTKPTVYYYFKNKDALFFSLMSPVIDDIHGLFEDVEDTLQGGGYADARSFFRAVFNAWYQSYDRSPETFHILQLFQQSGLLSELSPELREAMNQKGRQNFELARRIFQSAIDRGLIKPVDTYTMLDLLWGLTVGVFQLEDIKGDRQKGHRYKESALELAVDIFASGLGNRGSARPCPEATTP